MLGLMRLKRKPKASPRPVIHVERTARRWWQRQMVQLVCSCGWRSDETWLERSMVELAYVDTMTMRAFSEMHFNRAHRSGGSES